MQSQRSQPQHGVNPALQRFLKASGALFQRRLVDDADACPAAVAGMNGLEVSESSWDEWTAAAAQALVRD